MAKIFKSKGQRNADYVNKSYAEQADNVAALRARLALAKKDGGNNNGGQR